MSDWFDRLPGGMRITAPVVASGLAFSLAAFAVVMSSRSLVGSIFASSVDEAGADPLAALTGSSDTFIETSRRRFEGRSMYTLPPTPVRKPRVVEVAQPVDPPKDPGPPPPPATYMGPAPTSIFGDYVIFSTLSEDDKRIKVGDTVAGITVISVNAPFDAKLGYQRGEYVVSLWPRIDARFLRGGIPASKVSGITEAGASAAAGSPAANNGNALLPGAAGSPTAGIGGAAGAPRAGVAGGRPSAGAPGSAAGSPPRPAGSPNAGNPGSGGPGLVGPGAEPGAEPPASVGPEGGLPSPAMEPQEIPPPSPPSEQGEEYVDRSQLPQPLTDDRISAMSVAEAERAIRAIDGTSGWNVDDHSRARLDHERSQLQARVNRGG